MTPEAQRIEPSTFGKTNIMSNRNNSIIIDKDWLDKHQACASGVRWLQANTGIGANAVQILTELKKQEEWNNFYWLVQRVLTKTQAVEWAIFSAEQVLGLYEMEHPQDDRPRKAIEAAKNYLSNPCEDTRATNDAANAAYARDAANAAYAYATAYATANAAAASATAYYDAYYYATNAYYAAYYAAYAASDDAAYREIRDKCAEKAIELIGGVNL